MSTACRLHFDLAYATFQVFVAERADEGFTPGQIHTAMTTNALQRAQELNKAICKRKGGGLVNVPTLRQLQKRVYTLKKSCECQVKIKTVHELHMFVKRLNVVSVEHAAAQPTGIIQTPLTDPRCILTVNPEYAVENVGVVMLCAQQVNWISQLAERPKQFCIHMDGKYKLHHGGFILITVGTTHLMLSTDGRSELRNSFVPLAYLMKPAGESEEAATHLLQAINQVSKTVTGKALQPGETNSDHCDAFRLAYESVFPDAPFSQCYPHIVCNFRKGKYLKKTDPRFEEAMQHISAIHHATTEDMKNLLIHEIGCVWDTWEGRPMTTFWNSYCIPPWDNWSIGSFQCFLSTPSNNAQESWHKQILKTKINGMFKSSTERMFTTAIPKLMTMDTVNIPSELSYDVPAIPTALYEKALFYIENSAKFVSDEKAEDRLTPHVWYVLSESSSFDELTTNLLNQFKAACSGKKLRKKQSVDQLMKICNAVHVVRSAMADGVLIPHCSANLARLYCTCKGFKQRGICSHVLTITHLLKLHNVRAKLTSYGISKRAKNLGGYTKGVRPALVRENPDETCEELNRIMDKW